MSAIEQWKARVEAHHQQSQRAEADSSWSRGDFWRPFSEFFRDNPRRTDDATLERLSREVGPSDTVLDVGAGAGRFALPLALRCRHVTVVEPSESMIEGLRDIAGEHDIRNITVVQSTWEDAKVEPGDVVLCSHVVYGVADIEPFIRKLDTHARKKVLMLAFVAPPISRFSLFWKPVHGEERIDMPAMSELVNVLWEMDIYPNVEMLETTGSRTFENWDRALEQLRLRLYVRPDTEKDRRLQSAMGELLVETSDGVAIKGVPPMRLGLIWWRSEQS